MDWLLPRIFVALLVLTGGAVAGRVLGGWLGLPWGGACFGAGLAVAAVVALDALRGQRLMRWLREAPAGAVPSSPGLWGEFGYRLDSLVRRYGQAVETERQRLAQFLSAIEASPNGVLLLDADDEIDWCNRVSADHFALNPQRDLRQRVTNLVRSPAFVAYLQQGRFEQPVVITAPDGRTTLSVQVRPFGDGRKLVLSQDITERERADAMRRDFVANVSHEIRTPLTVLAGFVETMAGLPLTEVERRRVLQLMAQQTDRMQGLVSDLLTLAQLEGSPRPTADRWVAVAQLLRQAEADALSLSAGRHNFTFNAEGAPEIAGNELELQSAVGNLLTNAVRYTPEGGRIDVRWMSRPDGSGGIEVADTGIGVAREHIGRLTERFYRVDGSRSRETGGTGLGLSIVKHVMQRHGGSIDVDSEPGRGSRFTLVFPAARLRRIGAAPPVKAPSAATQP